MAINIFTFYNPDFFAALSAYKLQLAGNQTKIILSQKLTADSQFEFTSSYPEKLTDVVTTKLDYRFLNSVASLFPHLIMRKRVYTFHTNTEWNANFLAASDKLLGYDREMASFPINPNKLFKRDCKLLKKGAQVIEYSFDKHQATFELIKKCKAAGAKIIFEPSPAFKKNFIYSIPHKTLTILIPDKKLPINNPVILKSENFEIELYNVKENLRINIHPQIGQLDKQKIINTLQEIDIQLKKEDLMTAPSNHLAPADSFTIQEESLTNLRTGWSNTINQFKSKFNISKRTFNFEKPAEKLSDNYTNLQLACEQQYDMAKQTGIQFRDFELLYYRYINSIEDMIEAAYEKMSVERDPKKLWEMVLKDLERKEWRTLTEQ